MKIQIGKTSRHVITRAVSCGDSGSGVDTVTLTGKSSTGSVVITFSRDDDSLTTLIDALTALRLGTPL